MRIWKGLFYCYWMSDKPLVQEELAEAVSSMVATFPTTDGSLAFVAAFAKTFQCEWFGIDRWRMDKTMMFVRRFVRHTLRLLAARGWEAGLLASLTDILREHVVLTSPAKAALGFQLHFTDIFLEELAKAGGEGLGEEVVEALVQPWLELVATTADARLRQHAEERIFNHLVRQSAPGIRYQMEEDGMAEEEEGEDNGADDDSEEEGEVEEGEEESAEKGAEDPRAGRGDVVIPQISVNYARLGEAVFARGAGEEVRKAGREALYRIAKKLKDVAEDNFPLGPNLEEEELEIPRTSVKQAAAEMARRNERLKREDLASKKQAKLEEKAKAKAAKEKEEEGEDKDSGVEEDEEEIGDNGVDEGEGEEEETNGTKRKSESEDDEAEPEEKKPKRENQKKKKQERKRLKREVLLKKTLEMAERKKKMQSQLDHNMEVSSTLATAKAKEDNNVEKTEKKKKRKMEAPESNGHAIPVKKVKSDESSEELGLKKMKKELKKLKENVKPSEKEESQVNVLDKPVNVVSEISDERKKKKKKKKEVYQNSENVEAANDQVKKNGISEVKESAAVEDTSETVTKKKKKKEKKSSSENGKVEEKVESIKDTSMEAEAPTTAAEKEPAATDATKKLKKKKKQMQRIDSDICFGAPSLSKSNLLESLATPVATVARPTFAAIEEMAEVATPVATPEVSVKKKMKKSKALSTLVATPVKESKVFAEAAWDAPLQQGEQEILLPNKSYTGSAALAPALASALPGFASPQLAPAKSFTATFLNKAASKSATPKKVKKAEKVRAAEAAQLPKKKRINFA